MLGVLLLLLAGGSAVVTGFGVVGAGGQCAIGHQGSARVGAFLVTSGLPEGQGIMGCGVLGVLLILVGLAVVGFGALMGLARLRDY